MATTLLKPLVLLPLILLAPLACSDSAADDVADEAGPPETDTDSSDGSDDVDASDDGPSDTGPENSESDTTDAETTDTTESGTTDTDTTETGDGDGDLVLTSLEYLGTYESGAFDQGAAEIVDHHPASQRLFVINGSDESVDVLDFQDPTNPTLVDQFLVTNWGASPNSLAVHGDLVAVAVEANNPLAPGVVLFLDANTLEYINDVAVGVLPDMVGFSPDGTKVLVACEGQPADDYGIDPEGTIAIVDVAGDVAALTDGDVELADFSAFSLGNIDPDVRIFGPGSSVPEDLEPEYIAVSADSSTAWVTLQENNALAIVDIATATVTDIVALGFKDHSEVESAFDPSDSDDAIAIADWPVFGMYQPDGIASFVVGQETYLVTANEGDARDYGGFAEESRLENLDLDPMLFPNANALQADDQIGRLNVTEALGDIDNDGDYEELYAFGSRSISVWSSAGELIWDSGDVIEQQTAAALPNAFNSNNDDNDSFDGRSDNSGPEPEGVDVATLWGKPYAFIGLERIGGVMVFDLSDPQAPAFVLYDNSTRDFGGVPADGTAGDLGPEGLHVILAEDSPIGEPLVVVANEVSGTVSAFRIVGEAP